MTPQELLVAASEEIAKCGHSKHSYCTDTGDSKSPVCAYGAMTRVATNGRTADYTDTYNRSGVRELIDRAAALLDAQRIQVGRAPGPLPLFERVIDFNDDDSTTGEDVILAMKRAAVES